VCSGTATSASQGIIFYGVTRHVFLTADADWASGQSTINQSVDLRAAESIKHHQYSCYHVICIHNPFFGVFIPISATIFRYFFMKEEPF
jgi:hypothetical protein